MVIFNHFLLESMSDGLNAVKESRADGGLITGSRGHGMAGQIGRAGISLGEGSLHLKAKETEWLLCI